MLPKSRIMALLVVAAALPGCGVRPVTGGTKGVLRYGGKLLGDIQVTVHQVDGSSTQPIGFGVTANDGSFRLVKNGASGALWLSPGEYRCTLESAGAPIRLAKEYAKAETTPLKITWSAGDKSLDLEVPVSSDPSHPRD
jgi:hypothetical protein